MPKVWKTDPTPSKPLWACPACGHRFVTKNLWHSCGQYSLGRHFEGRAPHVRALFDAAVAAARQSGPVTVYAQKTRIVMQARVRFVSVVVHRSWIDLGLWLRRVPVHPRVVRVEDLGRLGFGVHFKLESRADSQRAPIGGRVCFPQFRPLRCQVSVGG